LLLIDLDGTVFRGRQATRRGADAGRGGSRKLFVTTRLAQRRRSCTHLRDLGFTVAGEDVVTSARAPRTCSPMS